MEIIITNNQLDRLLPQEDIQFVLKYKEQTGHYPKFRELQNNPARVGDYVPNHTKKDFKLKRYVDTHLGKFLNLIIGKLTSEKGQSIERGSIGSRNYLSIDNKQILRSELEVLTYNVFVLEGIADEIEVDSKRFLKSCGKIPDFVWEKKKIILEIAGMESDDYKSKLTGAEKCFNNLGYKTIIIDARPFEKESKYVNYYKELCDKLGFTPKSEVIESPYKYLGYRDVDREFRQKYIDDNINSLPLTSKQTYTLNKYINQLYGYGLKKYKTERELGRFRTSVNKNEIRKYKKQNPNLSNREIAKHFGVHKNTVQTATKGIQN